MHAGYSAVRELVVLETGFALVMGCMRMRDHGGKPDDSMMPVLSVRADDGSLHALGQVMTVLNRLPEHSMVPEMQHISRKMIVTPLLC